MGFATKAANASGSSQHVMTTMTSNMAVGMDRVDIHNNIYMSLVITKMGRRHGRWDSLLKQQMPQDLLNM